MFKDAVAVCVCALSAEDNGVSVACFIDIAKPYQMSELENA